MKTILNALIALAMLTTMSCGRKHSEDSRSDYVSSPATTDSPAASGDQGPGKQEKTVTSPAKAVVALELYMSCTGLQSDEIEADTALSVEEASSICESLDATSYLSGIQEESEGSTI